MQNDQEKYFEIDLTRLLAAVWHKAWVIALAAVVCAAAALGITKFLITPMYQADAMLYINNNKTQDQTNTISSADITASQSLAETYIAILNSRAVLSQTLTQAGSEYTETELQEMLSASVVNSTELIEVSVKDPDPEESAKLTNALVDVSSAKMMETVTACNVQIVDYAEIPENPASPSVTRNTAIGFLLGLLVSAAVIILLDLTNTVIRSEKDLNTLFAEIPVLGVIPELSMKSGSYGGYYSYGQTERDDGGSGKGKAEG